MPIKKPQTNNRVTQSDVTNTNNNENLKKVEPKNSKPNKKRLTKQDIENLDFNQPGTAVNEKTGLKYEKVGKVKFSMDGKPILSTKDISGWDLISDAQRFLPHARVPISKEELAKLQAEKEKMDLQAAREKAATIKRMKESGEYKVPEHIDWENGEDKQ